jgi:hypothetical protein
MWPAKAIKVDGLPKCNPAVRLTGMQKGGVLISLSVMTAKGWKGTGTYGVRVGISNAAQYFKRDWGSVEIEIDGELHTFPLAETFWTTCPEFRGRALSGWLLRRGLAPWPPRRPPALELTPIGGTRFRLSLLTARYI